MIKQNNFEHDFPESGDGVRAVVSQFDLQNWIGRTQSVTDVISLVQIRQMAAAMDDEARLLDPGCGPLPCGWHWLYFNPIDLQSRLSPDGHPPRGAFLPPVELPRRMWAGARLRWSRPFVIGSAVERRSTILSIERKKGRTGEMVFVTVGHQYFDGDGPILAEEHDIVYRAEVGSSTSGSAPQPQSEKAVERLAQHARSVTVDPVLLYRYSAATFNGHRIHYDADYCRDVEGYPGLVIHGPLIATLLLRFAASVRKPGMHVMPSQFDFKIRRPTFCDGTLNLYANEDRQDGMLVWSTDNAGSAALEGHIQWRVT